AQRLEIEAGGADDLHFRFFRDLGNQRGVAAKLDRARIDEALHAVLGAKLHQAPHRLGHELFAVEHRGRVELRAGEGDEQVLVHQRAAELVEADWPKYRLDQHQRFLRSPIIRDAAGIVHTPRSDAHWPPARTLESDAR